MPCIGRGALRRSAVPRRQPLHDAVGGHLILDPGPDLVAVAERARPAGRRCGQVQISRPVSSPSAKTRSSWSKSRKPSRRLYRTIERRVVADVLRRQDVAETELVRPPLPTTGRPGSPSPNWSSAASSDQDLDVVLAVPEQLVVAVATPLEAPLDQRTAQASLARDLARALRRPGGRPARVPPMNDVRSRRMRCRRCSAARHRVRRRRPHPRRADVVEQAAELGPEDIEPLAPAPARPRGSIFSTRRACRRAPGWSGPPIVSFQSCGKSSGSTTR